MNMQTTHAYSAPWWRNQSEETEARPQGRRASVCRPASGDALVAQADRSP
jgi:hypothetical protein